MGNENSSFAFLKLSNLIYSSGEYLTGELLIKIIDETESESVILNLLGEEVISFEANLENHKGNHCIINYEMVLHTWENGKISPGDYIFPFEVYLPVDIPSSSRIIDDVYKGSIEYKLQAFVNTKLSSSVNVIIKSDQNFPSTQNRSDTLIDLKYCFCVRRGTVELAAKINKFAYNSSEIIKLNIEGLCRLMPRVRINLFRSVLIMSENGKPFFNKTSLLEIYSSDPCLDIDLKSLENRLKTQITTKGNYYKCSFTLSVVGLIHSPCGNEEVEVILWILINPTPSPLTIPKLSMQWKPTYMNGMKYDFTI